MPAQTLARRRATAEDETGRRPPITWTSAADTQGPEFRSAPGAIFFFILSF